MDNFIKDTWQIFSSGLLNYIKSKVSDEHIAEDILQEVFIKLYKNVDLLKDQTKLKPWVYQITKNTITDYYRKPKEAPVTPFDLEKELKAEDEIVNMNNETIECLKSLMFELPEKYQEAIELYDIQELKHKDISERLNISISGSKTRVKRARYKLREILYDCCEFELDAFGNVIHYHQKKDHNCMKNNCNK